MQEENNILSYKEWLQTQPFSLNLNFQYLEYLKYVEEMRRR